MDAAELKEELCRRAKALGFGAVRVTAAPTLLAQGEHLSAFLMADRHGDMAWLARDPQRRASPQGLWPEARSIISLGTSYAPAEDPLLALTRRDRAAISVYAQGDDYHDHLKRRAKTLARWLYRASGAELKVFVDTAPVMEKPLAQQAGIGWQGKHTNLVSREFGSWLFLSEIYSAADIPADMPETDHCGGCHRCLDICPTAAFPAPYQLDARRCISYLTIEHQGPIPREFRVPMGNRIYGCDDCLAVCPWNKFAQAAQDAAFQPRAELNGARLTELAQLDDAGFRSLFRKSPIKRVGRDRFVRNILIALGNAGGAEGVDEAATGIVTRLLEDDSPLVRGMAVWALSRLAPERMAAARRRREPETDAHVLEEWQAAQMPQEFEGGYPLAAYRDS